MILRLKDLPIRVKIVGTFTAILLLTSIFNMIYFPASEKEQVNRALEDRAGSMVQMLAAGMESALGTGDYEFVNQLFEMVRTDPNIVYVAVVDQAGEPSISFTLMKRNCSQSKIMPAATCWRKEGFYTVEHPYR